MHYLPLKCIRVTKHHSSTQYNRFRWGLQVQAEVKTDALVVEPVYKGSRSPSCISTVIKFASCFIGISLKQDRRINGYQLLCYRLAQSQVSFLTCDSSKGDERSVFRRGESRTMMWFREIELRLFKITLCCLNLTQHYPVARTGRVGRIALVRITNCIPVVSGTNLIFLSLREHVNTHTQTRYMHGPLSKCQSCITFIDFCKAESSSSCYLPLGTNWHVL